MDYSKYKAFWGRWPGLFRDVTCGFWVPPGWLGLIFDLCHSLEEELTAEEFGALQVLQVKEKFGGLRFYVSGSCEAADALIEAACARSITICDQCGWMEDVQRRGDGWANYRCGGCCEE